MNFEACVEFVLNLEGGYVKNPKDPGGETNFGISKASYPHVDIKALTRDDAKAIYKRDYWDDLKLDEVPAAMRLTVFDCAVNQGKHFATATLQAILNLKVDGILGPKTLAAIQAADQKILHERFMLRRHEGYAKNPRWMFFGAGWSKRLLEVALESGVI